MNAISKGILAGIIATAVLSVIMLAKSMMGLMPELNVIAMLSGMMSAPLAAGWLAHFFIGAVWGVLFALAWRILPGTGSVPKGIVFGMIAWLAMMVIVMPMAGAGFFGLGLGVMAPVMTAMLHAIFGAVMGFAFDKQNEPAGASAANFG